MARFPWKTAAAAAVGTGAVVASNSASEGDKSGDATFEPTLDTASVAKVSNGIMLDKNGEVIDTEVDMADKAIWGLFRTGAARFDVSDQRVHSAQSDRIVSDGGVITVNGKEVDRSAMQRETGITVLTPAEAREQGLNVPAGSTAPVYTDLGVSKTQGTAGFQQNFEGGPTASVVGRAPNLFNRSTVDSNVIASTNPPKDYSLLSQKRVAFERDTETAIADGVTNLKETDSRYQLLLKARKEYDITTKGGLLIEGKNGKKEYEAAMVKYDSSITAMEDQFQNKAAKHVTDSAEYKLDLRQLTATEASLAAAQKAMQKIAVNSEAGKVLMDAANMKDGRQATIQATGTGEVADFVKKVLINNGQALPLYKDHGSDVINDYNLTLAVNRSNGDPGLRVAIGTTLEKVALDAEQGMMMQLMETSLLPAKGKDGAVNIHAGRTVKDLRKDIGADVYQSKYIELATNRISSLVMNGAVSSRLSKETAALFTGSIMPDGSLNAANFASKFSKETNLNDVAEELALLKGDIGEAVNSTSLLRTAGVSSARVNLSVANFINNLRLIEGRKNKEAGLFGFSAREGLTIKGKNAGDAIDSLSAIEFGDIGSDLERSRAQAKL